MGRLGRDVATRRDLGLPCRAEIPASPPSAMTRPELTIVMPVHNEEQAITGVVGAWGAELDRQGIDYELVVYDDGSTDRTRQLLADLASANDRLVVVEQANAGHGPTVLRGYRDARAEWIFQVDGDGELAPSDFDGLWRRRASHDLLIGDRRGRRHSGARRLVTWLARRTVRAVFPGPARHPPPRDVNCPYRLMRRDRLLELLPNVSPGAFAPNVALSGLAAAAGLRVYQAPVECRPRAGGRSSLRGLRLIRAAALSSWQTLAAARRFRRRQRSESAP